MSEKVTNIAEYINENFGANASYVEGLYDRYQSDKSLVDESWRTYFDDLTNGKDGQATAKPAEGKKVSLGFSDIGRGVTSSEWTDRNGEAHFDAKNGDGKVFVGGSTKFTGYLSGRVVVYI